MFQVKMQAQSRRRQHSKGRVHWSLRKRVLLNEACKKRMHPTRLSLRMELMKFNHKRPKRCVYPKNTQIQRFFNRAMRPGVLCPIEIRMDTRTQAWIHAMSIVNNVDPCFSVNDLKRCPGWKKLKGIESLDDLKLPFLDLHDHFKHNVIHLTGGCGCFI
jgi:hypothetical protein